MDNSKKNKKNKIKGLLTVVLLVILGITLITLGIKFYKLSSKEYILTKSINNIYSFIKENIIIPDIYKTDNYSLNINYQFNITGNIEDKNKNLIEKLNLSDNNLIIKSSRDNKKLLINYTSTKDNTNLINYKNYIEKSTNYLKLDEISKSYINTGNNNYFENLSREDTSLSNLDYILSKSIDLLPESISKDNLSMSKVNTLVNNKEKTLYKISYLIDNHELVKLYNNIKTNLKKDNKSSSILTNYNSNYFNELLEEKDKKLAKEENITINIYTDMFYNIIKYEIEHKNKLESNIYSLDIEDNNILLTNLKNHKIINYYYIKKSNNKYLIDVEDSKNKNVGNIEFENNKVSTNLILSYSDNDYKYEKSLDRKITDTSNGYESVITYNSTRTNLKTAEKDKNIVFKAQSKLDKDPKIEENIKNTILKDSLSKDKKEIVNNYKEYIINKLRS